ncbi:hypothetical protein [Winogradskyella vidalii]|uniref:hypothetical protein n=1 Tax=Winogradskyella vidalii TaxID=2615024 RepID=UPI0015CD2453|nr:hypothetical protein [Winogradskyella vidalii]
MINLVIQIIVAGIVATLVMTAFSYLLSAVTNYKLKEPQFINLLLSKSRLFSLDIEKTHLLGWMLHFMVGISFVVCYHLLRTLNVLNDSLVHALLFGLTAGLIGVAFWWITLRLHSNPPKLNRSFYLFQLIPAHIIFGVMVGFLM